MVIKKNVLVSIDQSDIKDGTIMIPSTVQEIKDSVFYNCSELTHIEIPDSVKIIGNSAFYNCSKLKSVKLPNNLKEIEFSMFENCSSLEEIIIPDSVTSMQGDIFGNCFNLKKVTLSKNIDRIPTYCFHNCKSLESIELPKNVKEIASSAFEGCKTLKNIKIPSTLEDIGSSAFLGCTSLEKIKIPKEMNSIGDSAFKDCSALKYFIFPKGQSFIDNNTFEHCVSLEEVIFVGNIYDVDTSAFKDCYSLKKIELPRTVNNISRYAFKNCAALEEFKVPPNITCISEGSFQNCSSLKAFGIPSRVQFISNSAFEGCVNLEEINIPNSVTHIGEDAFTNCPSLDSLNIPSSIISMQEIQNDNFLFFTKTTDGFTLSSNQQKDSLPIEKLKLNYAFISRNWKFKDKLLKEQNNPAIVDFYNRFLLTLPNDRIDEFIAHHNFTFFKQLNIETDRNNKNLYKFLYNIGAFEEVKTYDILDENNIVKGTKTIDYAQKVVGFIQEKMRKENIDIYTFAQRYANMPTNGFNREFTEFFIKEYDELIKEDKRQWNFVSKCYENFEEVQKTNTSHHGSQRQLKPTVEKFRLFFARDKFVGVTDKTELIARTLAPYFDRQLNFEDAVSIDKERTRKRVKNNILSSQLTEENFLANIDSYSSEIMGESGKIIHNLIGIADNEFSFEWLEKNDPQNFILGKLCSCCSHLGGAGYGIMHASIVHPYIQNLVIKNESGDIIAKSTLYINHRKRYGVCNNVEVRSGIKGEKLNQVYKKFILAINAFAVRYNKENPRRKLKQINVGMGNNDLYNEITSSNEESSILKPINYKKYGQKDKSHEGDSFYEQYAIWINPENVKQHENE